jgi:hypothetical protein
MEDVALVLHPLLVVAVAVAVAVAVLSAPSLAGQSEHLVP